MEERRGKEDKARIATGEVTSRDIEMEEHVFRGTLSLSESLGDALRRSSAQLLEENESVPQEYLNQYDNTHNVKVKGPIMITENPSMREM